MVDVAARRGPPPVIHGAGGPRVEAWGSRQSVGGHVAVAVNDHVKVNVDVSRAGTGTGTGMGTEEGQRCPLLRLLPADAPAGL